MNPFHFFESKWKFIFNVASRICIVSKFHMIMKAILFFPYSQFQMPIHPLSFPGFIPLFLCAGANEVLHFHLLEFPHAENKLSGNDLIPECFSNLCNAER